MFSHPTAILRQTNHPADNEKNTTTGIDSAKTVRGMICGARGFKRRKPEAIMLRKNRGMRNKIGVSVACPSTSFRNSA